MAAGLKGIIRNTGVCPICYRIVPNGDHPAYCRAPSRKAAALYAPLVNAA